MADTNSRYIVKPGLSRGFYVTDTVALKRVEDAINAKRVAPEIPRGAIRWFSKEPEAVAEASRLNGVSRTLVSLYGR